MEEKVALERCSTLALSVLVRVGLLLVAVHRQVKRLDRDRKSRGTDCTDTTPCRVPPSCPCRPSRTRPCISCTSYDYSRRSSRSSPVHRGQDALADGNLGAKTHQALRALLGVGADPIGRFAIVGALLQPLLDERTAARLMIVKAAAETEASAAIALYARDDGVERLLRDVAFDSVLTVGRWTPP